MPRGKRGGSRQGEQGKAYTNRTDLNENRKPLPDFMSRMQPMPSPLNPNRQPIQVASGLPYGERAGMIAAQKAVPLPAAPPVPDLVQPRPQGPAPGSLGAFNRPTEFPDEPLTAGMAMGPGAGPEAVSRGVALNENDLLAAKLRGLYSVYPNADVLALLDYVERRNNPAPSGMM